VACGADLASVNFAAGLIARAEIEQSAAQRLNFCFGKS
jgi:hypothetical protein